MTRREHLHQQRTSLFGFIVDDERCPRVGQPRDDLITEIGLGRAVGPLGNERAAIHFEVQGMVSPFCDCAMNAPVWNRMPNGCRLGILSKNC
ncbi:hypothetical protein CEXT_121691 [Caerostris extrusa]|uniref:Uncharacterized protein n=1 Tax=Caerostris extrusa TaxID=172846 RepID=A0AAV4N7B6_CAEEX|nr:hypothetical protein CEXT_121691 [Caerostris extrusa]